MYRYAVPAEEADLTGYKDPPRATQFRRGESGNPGGRPRKRPSFHDDLVTQLNAPIEVDGETISWQRALLKTAFREARRGDGRMLALIFHLALTVGPAANDNALSAADETLIDDFARRGGSKEPDAQ
jgi:hypothetical protein